ncbi:DUF4386 domain-containing protein [Plantactinospora sp. KLBMP9567]|uniref:DUF4386 domain-containing protein n=1 Tax=Plantactinospora sp. KLBMP9567 TaxID=3085900 RepID=UPI0029818151|nr:DUF4386 domain-containing protein [Plantactinospora sp. KLBMP9567]MDW5329651.1 DUF4386 domain-containing protein [Plantactinospora sp. KLBMP9567]
MQSPQRLARIAGLLYLAVAVLGGSAMFLRTRFYEPGDPATTADKLTADAGLFRVAVAANLAASMCWLFTAMALYLLFKHVNANWAGAMVIFTAAGATMELLNMAHEVLALVLATDASGTGAFADALLLLMFDLRHYGSLIAQIFFGLWLLPMGYLAYVSRMFPRALGVLLGIGCVGWIADTFVRLLAPNLGAALSPFLIAPAGIAEFTAILWMIVKGVRNPSPDWSPTGETR